MTQSEPERVTPELLDELRRIMPYDPEHLPLEIELMEAFRKRHPALPQVACFDTAFHRRMPRVASLLPIPRRYEVLEFAATVATFRPVSRTAMWLLVTYLAWVGFAAVLNFTLWRMNP